MKDMFRKCFRNALVFAAIGAAVAVAMPFVMGGLVSAGLLASAGTFGAAATTAGVMHSTLLFGLFGALVPPLEAAADVVFGKDAAGSAKAADTATSAGKQVNITIVQSPQQNQGQVLSENKYRQNIEAERLAVVAGEKAPGV